MVARRTRLAHRIAAQGAGAAVHRQAEFGSHDPEWCPIVWPSMHHTPEIASSRYRAPRNDSEEGVIASGAKQSRDVSMVRPAIRWPRLRLALVGLGISVVPLDTTVNIAFPAITGSFGLPIPMIQWVVICYVLTHAGLMLAFGRAGGMCGHGRWLRIGLVWSLLAFLLCAAARG